MSLYEGVGLDSKEKGQREQKPDLAGWSSGIKLLQSQLQLKKAALTQARREQSKKGVVLAPVLDLKSRKEDQDEMPPPPAIVLSQNKEGKGSITASLLGGEWDLRHEYDPAWPNDYEKIMKDRKERREKDREEDREKWRDMDDRDRRRRDRASEKQRDSDRDRDRDRDRGRGAGGNERSGSISSESGGGRGGDEEEEERTRKGFKKFHPSAMPISKPQGSGAAIAPPPSLLETPERKESPLLPPPPTTYSSSSFSGIGGSVAARIMAKYGFKEGQGLGKQEQGMSQALQVEKTSKRGGKIIHEKDIPKVETPPSPPSPVQTESITEIMKNPSKVVLLRNMVGPGEVDEELEPETKEECGKYGDVIRCLIFEIPGGNVPDEEAVRIFIEFKRLESAIKAVVDLNGRYFGGRVVRASFYGQDKFRRLELAD